MEFSQPQQLSTHSLPLAFPSLPSLLSHLLLFLSCLQILVLPSIPGPKALDDETGRVKDGACSRLIWGEAKWRGNHSAPLLLPPALFLQSCEKSQIRFTSSPPLLLPVTVTTRAFCSVPDRA